VSGRSAPAKGFAACRSSLVFFFCFLDVTVMKPSSSATCSALSPWLFITTVGTAGAGAGVGGQWEGGLLTPGDELRHPTGDWGRVPSDCFSFCFVFS